jgi:F0F1-type ATP synthase epsilon subunit
LGVSDSTSQGWFNGVMSILLAVIAYILNLYRGKVDVLEENYVKKDELERLFEEERQESKRKHLENRQDRAEDRQAVINLAQRIDRFLERQ